MDGYKRREIDLDEKISKFRDIDDEGGDIWMVISEGKLIWMKTCLYLET